MAHSTSVPSTLKLAWTAVVQTFWIFCENSSLHGLRYIGRNRTAPSNTLLRFLWSVIALVSLGFTMMLGNSAWDQFRSNPTLTTIETTSYPVSLIPFPSVTLCNINKIHATKAEELGKKLMEFGMNESDAIDVLYTIPRLIDYPIDQPIERRILDLEEFLQAKGYDAERMAFEVAPPCETMMVHCFWLMQDIPCSKLFRRTKIFAGYCCSFNVDGFLEPVFTRPKNPNRTENIYVSGIGKGEGLSVLVDIGERFYTASERFSNGIEVFVHRSFDFPDFSDYTTIVQRGMETDLSILPSIVAASPSLRTVPLAVRGCAFGDEGNSTTSVPYTYSNCMNECETRYIAGMCSCIPLFKQTVELQEVLQVPICGFRDLTCLLNIKQHVTFTSENVGEMIASDSRFINVVCNCYPSCTIEKNEVLAIQNTVSKPQHNKYKPEFNFTAYGVLHVHFRSTSCLKYKREPFVTWQTLVATFGGIFGLCMGGSILSLVEMLYHFGITPFVEYSVLRNKLLKGRTHPAQKTNVIAYMDYPAQPPMGYFRRREIMARATGNDEAAWVSGNNANVDNRRWKQHYVNELKILP
ncbi:sodium channel protein Nach-like [Anopheles nili]|uniref:sodium channel protein Nach-like n=1 Tax=Anopheles nili TaxID=185578 RepID=UPI00237A3FA7|nr:sodium channel protein Nach-like [Anopheles nili]